MTQGPLFLQTHLLILMHPEGKNPGLSRHATGSHSEATELEEVFFFVFCNVPSTTLRIVGESKSCWHFPLPCSYYLGAQHLFYKPSLLLPANKTIKWVGDKVCVLTGNWLQWKKESRAGLRRDSAVSLSDSLPFIGNTQFGILIWAGVPWHSISTWRLSACVQAVLNLQRRLPFKNHWQRTTANTELCQTQW